MVKDHIDQCYYVGAWYDSSWYRTLCTKYVVDDFGNLIRVFN